MNLEQAKVIANVLITLGSVGFKQIRNAVSPLYKVLESFASQGQQIVYGSLRTDNKWIVCVEDGDPRDGDLDESEYPAIDVPEGLNEDCGYQCIGLLTEEPYGEFVTILAVGTILDYRDGTPEPPPDELDVDQVVSHALAMSAAIVKNPYEDTEFSDLIHEYGKSGDRKILCGVRPIANRWGQFTANAKTWADGNGEEVAEALKWLVMNSTGHPYVEAVQLRVKAGYMKVEDIFKS